MAEIVWTKEAIKTYNQVLDYLSERWPEKVSDDFILKLKKVLYLLKNDNISFRRTKWKNIHEVLITRHNLLIYRKRQQIIELLLFYDTRQHPRRKKI